jgi:hypothetical protein
MRDLYTLIHHFEEHGINVPRHFDYKKDTHTPNDIFRAIPPPWLVSFAQENNLQYVRVATFPKLFSVLEPHDEAFVEEVVAGDSYCVGIIRHYRGQDLYSLPIFENKYGRVMRTPHLDEILKTRMIATAKKLFTTYDAPFGLLVYFTHRKGDLFIFDVEKFEEDILPQFLDV